MGQQIKTLRLKLEFSFVYTEMLTIIALTYNYDHYIVHHCNTKVGIIKFLVAIGANLGFSIFS